jgi:thiamine biosynthesis lipoprotein
MSSVRTLLRLAFAAASVALLPLPGRCAEEVFLIQRPHMGCLFTFKLCCENHAKAKEAADAASLRLEELEKSFSDYQQQSELNLLCASAGKGQPVAVSEPLFAVLEKAESFSRWSDGAFDITLGTCTRLWRQSRKTSRLPDISALTAARDAVGWRNVACDPKSRTVLLKTPGMQLDLGGIAKGFALDDLTSLLAAKFALKNFLLDAGGQIAAMGAPPSKDAWTLAVEKTLDEPDSSRTCVVRLSNLHLATSGDLHQFVEIDGKRYSHIIDPATGLGATTPAQASVISADGTTADAAATVLCIVPPEAGLKLLAKLPRTEARIVRKLPDGNVRVWTSPGWSKHKAEGK